MYLSERTARLIGILAMLLALLASNTGVAAICEISEDADVVCGWGDEMNPNATGVSAAVSAATTEVIIVRQGESIQDAIDAAATDGVIVVEPGLYVGGIDFRGKNLTLQSAMGPNETTIDGDFRTGIQVGPRGALIGFTIINSSAGFGAGIRVSGAGTLIQGNVFEGNRQEAGGFGAGIGGNSASPIVDGNIFRGNLCDNQFLSGVVSFVNSSSPVIVNNIFEDNPCRAINLTLPVGNRPLVINNTFVRNRVGVRVDRRIDASLLVFQNNIIAENQIGLEIDFGSEANNPTWAFNDVFGNGIEYDGIVDQTGSNDNISVDPLFLDSARSDYRLTANSPAIDVGNSVVFGLPETDFNGAPRVRDGDEDGVAVVDLGAVEADGEPLLLCSDALEICEGSLSDANSSIDALRLHNDELAEFNALLATEVADLRAVVQGLEAELDACLIEAADDDGDQVPNDADRCPGSTRLSVDTHGCTQSQFCGGFEGSGFRTAFQCYVADWSGNGPGRGDCRLLFNRRKVSCASRSR